MADFTTQVDELKTLLSSCASINSNLEKSSFYSSLLQLQECSATDSSLLQPLADSSHLLLSLTANDISHDDEEIASQALKCMGFMIYHPSIVNVISGDDADLVLISLQKVILSTRIKSVCNLGVWCISVQQLNPLSLNAHIESLVRAIVHALDNPTGSLSTTFEAMQAVMKLETQVNENMRDASHLWAPPIYRRLVSTDKRERDMSQRCLQKIKSLVCPPTPPLSKIVIVDVKRKLLPAMEEQLKHGMKIQAMQAWGWYIRLIGPYAVKSRQLINQLLKIPEQTFPDSDPQVKIASQIAWEALIDALIILPTQESTTVATQETYEYNDDILTNGLTKSIKLIMTPLISVMSSKCDLSVHSSCLNSWNYLLRKLEIHVNHPSIIKTVLEPILEEVFRAGPNGKNICSWNFCLDIINSYALARKIDDEKHHAITFMPWKLGQFDFLVKMVHFLVGHGKVGCDAGLKVFCSSLKTVRLMLSRSNVAFGEVMSSIDIVINCLKKMSESGMGQTFDDFLEIATKELQPSILGSPLYKVKLDAKYTENMDEMIDDMNTVSPVMYFTILYFHHITNSTFDGVKLSKYVTFLLRSYDSYDILRTLTCLLYKFLIPNWLNYWIVIANCLKDCIDGKPEPDDSWDFVVSRFLAYPFSTLSSLPRKNLDFVQIVQLWRSVFMSTKCCEKLCPVFDRFLEDYSNIDPTENVRGYELLSFCGDAIICVLEHIVKPSNDAGDDKTKRLLCTKTSLQCAARYLSVSYTEEKSNPLILDTTSRVFSTLARVVESFHFDEDIVPFVEVISNPLLQWISDFELQHENTIHQIHQLWITTLKSLQISWPPINFNSSFLELQATLLEATLDHPNLLISNPTIAFWNSTYGQQVKLDYPLNLLPVLDKLSRNGKINLCKKRYIRIDAASGSPKKHKVTTALNRCVKRVELMGGHVNEPGGSGSKKKVELTEHQKEVKRAQQGKSKDCEGRGPGVRTYTSVDFSQGTQDESQEDSQDVRNVECILEMLRKDDKML